MSIQSKSIKRVQQFRYWQITLKEWWLKVVYQLGLKSWFQFDINENEKKHVEDKIRFQKAIVESTNSIKSFGVSTDTFYKNMMSLFDTFEGKRIIKALKKKEVSK